MNYAKKYSGVPLKRASLSGKSWWAMVLMDQSGCTGGRVALTNMSGRNVVYWFGSRCMEFERAVPGNSGRTGRRGRNSGRTGRRGRNSGSTGRRGRRFNVACVRTQRRRIWRRVIFCWWREEHHALQYPLEDKYWSWRHVLYRIRAIEEAGTTLAWTIHSVEL